jgi:hypothetical protein
MTVDVTTYQYRVQYLRTQTDGEPRTREPKNHLSGKVTTRLHVLDLTASEARGSRDFTC